MNRPILLLLIVVALTLLWQPYWAHSQGEATIHQLKWSPDGAYIAGASSMGVYVWDAATQALVAEVVIAQDGDLPTGAGSVAWDSSSTFLYIGSAGGGIIYTYDLLSQTLIPYQTDHPDGIVALGVSSNYIVSVGGFEGGSYIWDRYLQPISLPILENIYGGDEVEFNKEGTKFLLVDSAGAKLINPIIPEDSRSFLTRDLNDTVSAADWSPDETKVVTGTYYGKIAFWDTTTYQMFSLWQPAQPWTFPEYYLVVEWNPTVDLIISADGTGTVKLWDVSTGEPILIIPNVSRTVDWSPDGRRFVYGGDGLAIVIQDTPVVAVHNCAGD